MLKTTSRGGTFLGPFHGPDADTVKALWPRLWTAESGVVIALVDPDELDQVPEAIILLHHQQEADAAMRRAGWGAREARREACAEAFRGVYWDAPPYPPEDARGAHYRDWDSVPHIGGCSTLLTKTQANKAGFRIAEGAEAFATIRPRGARKSYNLYSAASLEPIRVRPKPH